MNWPRVSPWKRSCARNQPSPRVKAKTKQRFALSLLLAPWAVIGVIRYFGGRPVIVHWGGPLLHPTDIGFELHNFGLVLIATSLVGFLWLVYLFARSLWSTKAD